MTSCASAILQFPLPNKLLLCKRWQLHGFPEEKPATDTPQWLLTNLARRLETSEFLSQSYTVLYGVLQSTATPMCFLHGTSRWLLVKASSLCISILPLQHPSRSQATHWLKSTRLQQTTKKRFILFTAFTWELCRHLYIQDAFSSNLGKFMMNLGQVWLKIGRRKEWREDQTMSAHPLSHPVTYIYVYLRQSWVTIEKWIQLLNKSAMVSFCVNFLFCSALRFIFLALLLSICNMNIFWERLCF